MFYFQVESSDPANCLQASAQKLPRRNREIFHDENIISKGTKNNTFKFFITSLKINTVYGAWVNKVKGILYEILRDAIALSKPTTYPSLFY